MLDLLCVGDSVVDIFLKINENNPNFGLDKEKNKLFVSYGEKINVEKHIMDIGGNATNTSVGVSRLNLNVGIYAEIGKDEFSQKILTKLKNENINIDLIIQTQNENTSFSVGINYKGERTLLVEHVKRGHDFNFENVSAKYIYLTSLGDVWEKAYKNTLGFIDNNDTKLAFNPGTLQIEKRDKLITDIIEKTDYLFLNKQEAEKILYSEILNLTNNNHSHIKKLLYGLRSLGAKNVIITDSKNGSFLQNEDNNIYFLKAFDVEVIEKTGAGDAYTSGFLAAVIKGKTQEEAMIWGTLNSANVIQKIGAQEGLLTENEIKTKIIPLSSFYPEQL